MKSYYKDIAELIERDFRFKAKMSTISMGELRIFEPPTLWSKVKKFFSRFFEEKETGYVDYSKDYEVPQNTTPVATYTSYSGADLVVSVGTQVVGELTNIRWYAPNKLFLDQLEHSDYYDKELALKKPVVVLAEWTIFDRDVFASGLDNADIVLTYANEYGHTSYRAIHGVSSLYTMSGTSIDEVVNSGFMILAAETVTELKPGVKCTK